MTKSEAPTKSEGGAPEQIQSLGGKARMASLSKKERSRLSSEAARKRWARADPSLPKATHEGPMRVGESEIPCYVLSDERRVISQSGMAIALGMSKGGDRKVEGDRIANFLAGKRLKPFATGRLESITNSVVRFATRQGLAANGYEAALLSDICDALVRAADEGALTKNQAAIGERARVLRSAFTKLGIVALVDEATGYQAERPRDELTRLLRMFVAEEIRKWVSTFPLDYYKEIFRLKRWPFTEKNVRLRPSAVGLYTNNIVYARLAPGILEELRRVNPKDENGRRRAKHHQHLTTEIGHPALRGHLTGLIYLMRASSTWEGFLQALDKAMPAYNTNYELDLPEKSSGAAG